MKTKQSSRLFRLLALLFACSLFAAACVSSEDDEGAETETTDDAATDDEPADDDADADDEPADADDDADADDEPADEPDEPQEPEVIEPFDSYPPGVTAARILLGMSMLDFEQLTSMGLSPAGWGDQQAVFEALIADLNDRGGINGRMVEGVYDFYSALDAADAERVCAIHTQDNQVFANLAGFVGPAGTADTCVTGTNETIMIGGEIAGDELEKAVAPWFHTGPTAEFQTINLLNLLVQTGRADGAKVFVMGGAAAASEEEFVIAQLEERDIEVVGSAVIEAPDGDTIAQDQELAVAFELFKSSGANTLMLFGTPSAQIRGAGAAGLTGEIAMWSNDSGGLGNLGATIVDKSIADGTLVSTGPTDTEIWEDQAFQDQCVAPVVARVAEADLRDPTTYGPEEENWFNALRRYCHVLSIFEQIATEAGVDLTPETFLDAAYGGAFDDFQIPGIGPASISDSKRGAQDGLRLSAYDSTIGDGGIGPVTELLDAFE